MVLIRTPVRSCHRAAVPLAHTVRRKCSLGARPCGERLQELQAVTAPCLEQAAHLARQPGGRGFPKCTLQGGVRLSNGGGGMGHSRKNRLCKVII